MNWLANLILSIAVPRARRACLVGDLLQLYSLERERKGWLRAGLWFWGEIAHAVLSYSAYRVMRRFRTSNSSNTPSPVNRPKNAMESIRQDIGYAIRALRRTPGFTAATLLTISLGIGATTTIFSVASAVLLRAPRGVRNPGEMVTVHRVAADGSSLHAFGYPGFEDLRNGDNGLAGLAAFSTIPVSLSRIGDPEIVMGFLASENYFDVAGVRPAFGRLFLASEGGIETPHLVAVLSHSTWSRRFGSDSSVVGQDITINRQSFTVVGVAEEGFSGHATLLDVGVFIPLSASVAIGAGDLAPRNRVSLETVGRLAEGVAIPQVQRAMDLIAQRMAEAHPEAHRGEGVEVRGYTAMFAAAAGPATAFLALLFAVSTVILLIACINVGGMLLARASTRGKEMALRLAIGAPRARLIRQLLTESIVLFVLGGGAGAALTLYLTRLLNAVRPPIPLPVVFDFTPDGWALALSLGLGLTTGLVFGLAPALHITRHDLNTSLRREGSAAPTSRLRSTFVVGQVAGTALLLVCAGLFIRGLARADGINLGMDPNDVHSVMVDLGIHNYTPAAAAAFYDDLTTRIREMPDVESVGLIDLAPLSFGNQTSVFFIEGRQRIEGVGLYSTDFAVVTPTYFETMRIPLGAGRGFTSADRDGNLGVVIVNEEVARTVWPGENPVGKHVKFGSSRDSLARDVEVIGVVPTGKYRSVGEDDRNMVYLPYAQLPKGAMAVMMRVEGQGSWTERMRNAVDVLDPALPLQFNGRYRELLSIALLPNRAAAWLALAFGCLGLLLACIGLYGVLAFSVLQRSREIGIRLAIGAQAPQIRAMVLKHGLRLAGVGLALGFTIAIASTGLLRGLLFGVSPVDPLTFGGIAALLMMVAAGSAWIPAMRATRTDAVKVLRQD